MTKLKFSDLTEKQREIINRGLLLAAIADTQALTPQQSSRMYKILDEAARHVPNDEDAYQLGLEIYRFTADELMNDLEDLCK
jgi:hypothetical protein